MTTRSDPQTNTAYTPDSGAPAPEKASLFEDFIDVFYAPSSVYERRRASSFWPHFWIISILGAVMTLASRSVMSAALDGDFMRRMAAMQAKNPRLTDDMVNTQRGFNEMLSMAMMYLGMPLLMLVVAVLVWVGARVVSARMSLDRAMLVGVIAQVPRLLGALLTAIYGLLLTDTSSIDGMARLTWSPARFMDPATTDPAILALLTRIDVFTIWATILIGIGVAVIARAPRSRGFAAAGIVWAVPTVMAIVGALMA